GQQDGAVFPGDILGYRAVIRHVGKELDELTAQENGTLADLYETFTAEEHEKWYVRVEPVMFDGNGTLLSKYYCGPGWNGQIKRLARVAKGTALHYDRYVSAARDCSYSGDINVVSHMEQRLPKIEIYEDVSV